jgi:hypothetical protein
MVGSAFLRQLPEANFWTQEERRGAVSGTVARCGTNGIGDDRKNVARRCVQPFTKEVES